MNLPTTSLGLLYLFAFLVAAGCTSIRSTQLFRATDSKFSAYCMPWGTKGVPCKLQVETGLRVEIKETYFIDVENGKEVSGDHRLYEVTKTPIFSDQVFLVHIPRPMAGTLDLSGDKGYHFTNGYLTKIGASVDDTTIEDITTILGPNSLGGLLKTGATADPNALEAVTRTVAVREFSFADPCWHLDLNEWINLLPKCDATCPANCQATGQR
jgi:hypothetical protein